MIRPVNDHVGYRPGAVPEEQPLATQPSVVPVVVVTAPACHLCDDALHRLRAVAEQARLDIRVVELESDEGRALVAAHRPPMSPLVLVDGVFFSSGRLPQRKVDALLRVRGGAALPLDDVWNEAVSTRG